MSDYVHETVIRYKPTEEEWEKLDSLLEEEYQNSDWGLSGGDFVKEEYKKFFRQNYRQKSGYFETAPTCEHFLDFVLLEDDDTYGDFGKVRRLTDKESMLALPMFRKIIPTIENTDNFRLVDFC